MTRSKESSSRATPRRRRSPGRPPASEQSAADTRARIRQAAIELFSDKGFHGTGVAEIGERADVQPGALYYHIGSKEGLLWEVMRDYLQTVLDAEQQVAARGLDPLATLVLLTRTHAEEMIRASRQILIHMRDRRALTPEHQVEIGRMREQLQQIWQDTLVAGKAAGLLRSDDPITANSVVSMLNGVGQWYRPGRFGTASQVADQMVELVLDAVGADPAERARATGQPHRRHEA